MSQELDKIVGQLSQEEQQLYKLRHTAEHVLHQALKEIYPQIKLAMGPATADGFYCDFDTSPEGSEPIKISEADFKSIEKRMWQLINKNLPLTKKEVSVKEAKQLFADNPYKLEWIDQIEERGEKVTVYWTGEPGDKDSMVDLCSGPHADSTGAVKAFKLLSTAGAYWHGDEKNKMLTRIYGTAFDSKEKLKIYLHQLEEAKKRDHKLLGQKLDLFTFSDSVGKGLPLWTPKGSVIRRELERFIVDEEIKRGYLHVYTPDIANLDLYKKSGHYPYYKDSMYAPITIDDEEYMLRPMTCPHHFELYLSKPRSYRELPMRIAELAHLYRYEQSGELSGLQRVRTFTLADAHIICSKNQAEKEINSVLDLIEFIADVFGLKIGENYWYRLSLGDRLDEKKYFKDDNAWDHAENVLRKVLKDRQAHFVEAEHEAAFYGPKIDIQMKNVNGKEDTAFTVQYDFVFPKRFELNFVNEHNQLEEAVVVHRSSIGATERVMAFLIEHFGGAFPVWLAPIQAVVIPISDDQLTYAQQLVDRLKSLLIRAELWSQGSMQKNIRTAEQQKIPYMLVVGKKEAESQSIAVRKRGQKDLGSINIDKFITQISTQIDQKHID